MTAGKGKLVISLLTLPFFVVFRHES